MKVVLNNVRLSFPDLFEAVRYKGEGKPRFSAAFLITPGSDNDIKIQEAIRSVAAERWGEKAPAKLKAFQTGSGKYCYVDGNSKDYEGVAGMMILNAHRNQDQGRPKIVDRSKQELTPESGKPYAGCYVNAVIDIWAQGDPFQGMRATLSVVQYYADGEPFAGSVPSLDDLPAIEDVGEELSDLV